MSNADYPTRENRMSQARIWFRLDRHDGSTGESTPDTGTAEPPADATGTDAGTGEKDWKAEAEKWKALARKHEGQAKSNATAAQDAEKYKQQLDAILKAAGEPGEEEGDAPDEATAQLTQRAERAEAMAFKASVRSDIRALAGQLGIDAEAALDSNRFMDDLADAFDDKSEDDPGHISRLEPGSRAFMAEIERAASVAAEKSPRLKAAGQTGPRPDPSQGRGGQAQPTDFRKASKEDLAAEAAKYGIRLRS